ncbi:hypothetical protein B4U79_00243 [Dinothrombium tinctorium]|uniref:Essential MCU regulator, mitochondrial n=1 Tax=Dinothrombium tinctorium TaxID=1965070 RepID=A0A3S3S9G2_9ACAR|nr:hypothetical protein B4U79_00243 [Dinothrombium tinctorium]
MFRTVLLCVAKRHHSTDISLIPSVRRVLLVDRMPLNRCFASQKQQKAVNNEEKKERVSGPCFESTATSSSIASEKQSFNELDELLARSTQRPRFGLLKVMATILLGVYFGAFIAKLGANLLEEYEIFVHGENEDD